MSDLWTYNADHRKRPNVHPLCSPSGAVLTRDAPPDHPWHHALWFTIKYVNGENFWEEQDSYGVLRHVSPTTVHWIRPDRETVVIIDERSLAHVDLDDGAYGIDWSVTLTPQVDVVLDRTEFTTWGGYGGLAFRGRPDWTDTRLLLTSGVAPEPRVLGEPSPWCDLAGTVEGGEAGVLFLDHPANPSYPVPWYASTRADNYGEEGWSNFLNAAFLWNGPLEVAAQQLLPFRYRVVVHNGVWDAARCAAEWERWVG